MSAGSESFRKAAERRVLFLARHLDSGGVTTHMMTLALGLMKSGWEVGLASAGQIGDHDHGPAWFEASQIRHFQVPFIGPGFGPDKLVKPLICGAKVDAAVRSFKPSLIHVHWRSTSVYAALVEWTRHTPFVTSLHSQEIPSEGVLRQIGSKWGSHAIAVSQEARDHLVSKFRVAPEQISIVHNGVDPDMYRPPTQAERASAREKFDIDLDVPVVCLLGRLETAKGHHVLLKAADLVHRVFPQLQVLLAGEGSQREAISDFARSTGLEHCIHFLGYSEGPLVLWASDILVLPSYQEGFALAPIEAMLCGVPVIRTPAGGATEQVSDGVTGFVVPFGDHEALADRMGLLLSEPELARRVSAAARAKALDSFTVDVMVRATESIYLRVLDETRGVL